MGIIPNALRDTIARNIRMCRLRKFPGRGGAKKCAEAFGVSPQQWSPWEKGRRLPDELRLEQIAEFFGVPVEWLRQDHRPAQTRQPDAPPFASGQATRNAEPFFGGAAGGDFFPQPGSAASFFWLAHRLVTLLETQGLRLDRQSLEYLSRLVKLP